MCWRTFALLQARLSVLDTHCMTYLRLPRTSRRCCLYCGAPEEGSSSSSLLAVWSPGFEELLTFLAAPLLREGCRRRAVLACFIPGGGLGVLADEASVGLADQNLANTKKGCIGCSACKASCKICRSFRFLGAPTTLGRASFASVALWSVAQGSLFQKYQNQYCDCFYTTSST